MITLVQLSVSESTEHVTELHVHLGFSFLHPTSQAQPISRI